MPSFCTLAFGLSASKVSMRVSAGDRLRDLGFLVMGMGCSLTARSCLSELNAVHPIAKGKKPAHSVPSVPLPLQGAGQWEYQ